jgi:GTP cyclohydrolase I
MAQLVDGDWPERELSDEEIASELLQRTTGLDVDSEHGYDTPTRFVKMLRELTTPAEIKFTTFSNTEEVDEMVVVKDIEFYTFCNHHIIPFFGVAHVAYVPDQLLVGLSKFARVVRETAKGLWVQEHLTIAIADYLEEHLEPKGLAVVMEAEHLCMTMRGVQVPGARTTTAAMRGVFADHSRTAKAEFLQHIRRA